MLKGEGFYIRKFRCDKEKMMEYRIEVKVKNNQILKRIEEAGYKSICEFCRLNDRKSWTTQIGNYVNLRETPLNAKGEFYPHVYEIASLLNCSPEDLFTITQMQTAIESNKRTLEVNEAEIKFALSCQREVLSLEDQVAKDRMPEKIRALLKELTPREEKVVRMRYGIDCEFKTYEQAAGAMGVTRERIRQIEAKAIRKLRHPKRREPIEEYAPY